MNGTGCTVCLSWAHLLTVNTKLSVICSFVIKFGNRLVNRGWNFIRGIGSICCSGLETDHEIWDWFTGDFAFGVWGRRGVICYHRNYRVSSWETGVGRQKTRGPCEFLNSSIEFRAGQSAQRRHTRPGRVLFFANLSSPDDGFFLRFGSLLSFFIHKFHSRLSVAWAGRRVSAPSLYCLTGFKIRIKWNDGSLAQWLND